MKIWVVNFTLPKYKQAHSTATLDAYFFFIREYSLSETWWAEIQFQAIKNLSKCINKTKNISHSPETLQALERAYGNKPNNFQAPCGMHQLRLEQISQENQGKGIGGFQPWKSTRFLFMIDLLCSQNVSADWWNRLTFL